MAERPTIFSSCGQYAEEERKLGKQVCKLVEDTTAFTGYFADNQTTLKALSENVLRRLYESVGLIVIMHHRGNVESRNIIRGSVWIEQEVAIATLMEQILRRPLHVALFVQRGIAIEGIRQQLQLNAIEFNSGDQVIAHLREILPDWRQPLYRSDEEIEKLVDSVDLSITAQGGIQLDFTIDVENHSAVDVEVKSIGLSSKGGRICKPVSPPEGTRWSVPAHRSVPIRFTTAEDIASRLANIYNEVWTQRLFRGELDIELRCEILGVTKSFKETRTVQVDYRGRQIIGL
jgi:hypothetical protein